MNKSILRHILFVALIPIALSCGGEEAESSSESSSSAVIVEDTPFPSAEESAKAMTWAVRGEVRVRLSEAMTRAVEEGHLSWSVPIRSMERLFPNAGKFEGRTRREGLHRWYKVYFDKEIPLQTIIGTFSEIEGIELTEAVPKTRIMTDDERWSDMWGLENSAFGGPDINCVPVWQMYSTGDPKVVVAVVDGGIQLSHPDLRDNCLETGHYNYVDNRATLSSHSHGTHVAGTIAAVSNNGIGVAGIAGGDAKTGQRGVSLLSLQIFKSTGSTVNAQDQSADGVVAIKEAADKGAHVCQNSWGYVIDVNGDGEISQSELRMAESLHNNPQPSFKAAVDYFIKYAGCDDDGNQLPDSPMKGGIVVFAAGNDDISYGAPGNYEPCVSVAAINQLGQKADFSNYGDWVDFCAPGVDIVSTVPTNRYAKYSGTSMACPHVSGVIALILSARGGQGVTPEDILLRLRESADHSVDKTFSIGPLVNAYGAVCYGGDTPPEQISEYNVNLAGNNIIFDFIPDSKENLFGFRVFVAKDERSFESMDPSSPPESVLFSDISPFDYDKETGNITLRFDGLEFDADYYVAIAGYSFNRVYSPLSSVKAIHTQVNHPVEVETDFDHFQFFRQHQTVRIPFHIYDPDGHSFHLSYQTNGRERFAFDKESGDYIFYLECQLVRGTPANFEADISLKDEFGKKSTYHLTYSVDTNHAPIVSKILDNIYLGSVGSSQSVSLSDYFTDPDEEDLHFSLTRLNGGIVNISSENDGEILFTAVSEGVETVIVTASDRIGAKLQYEFKILVRDPSRPFSLSPEEVVTETLSLFTGVEPSNAKVTLVSSSGVVVISIDVDNCSAFNPITLDMSELSPGAYTLCLSFGGEEYKKTIIKR